MTIRMQVLRAAQTALNTNRPADVPEVTLRRTTPGEAVRDSRLSVFLGEETALPPRNPGDPFSQRRVVLVVQAIVPVEEPGEADEAIEPLLAWAEQALGHTSLGGLAHQTIYTGTQWQPYQLDVVVAMAMATYEIAYHSTRGDPYSR